MARAELLASPKWSIVLRPAQSGQEGEIELGDLFCVHRGQVTGANDIWIAGEQAQRLPEQVLVPTYMARRAPQFTVNACDARHINVAHGLYPREPMASDVIAQIVAWLDSNIDVKDGRTYSGGLTKFEPKEVERLRMPGLDSFVT